MNFGITIMEHIIKMYSTTIQQDHTTLIFRH